MTTQTSQGKTRLKGKDPKSAEPSKPKILIFGLPGVGKTWTAMDFPGVYYIDTEGGADLSHYTDKLKASGGVYMGPEDGALDFDVIIDQIKALASEKHPHRTLVIDSISKVFNVCVTNEAERLGDKDAYGASKKPAIAQMRRLVNWVERIDMNVIFIAHEKADWGLDIHGARNQIGVTFDCWEKLEYELHLVLQIVRRGDSRVAMVRKSRLEGFPDKSSFPWSYQEFAQRYGRMIVEAPVVSIALATVEQLEMVNHLVDVVRVSDEDKEKWFTKAGVASFAEMDSGTIDKVIEFLKKKVAS